MALTRSHPTDRFHISKDPSPTISVMGWGWSFHAALGFIFQPGPSWTRLMWYHLKLSSYPFLTFPNFYVFLLLVQDDVKPNGKLFKYFLGKVFHHKMSNVESDTINWSPRRWVPYKGLKWKPFMKIWHMIVVIPLDTLWTLLLVYWNRSLKQIDSCV